MKDPSYSIGRIFGLMIVAVLLLADFGCGASSGGSSPAGNGGTTPAGGPSVNGIYYLGKPDDASVPSAVLANPNIPGIAVRATWAALEPSDGAFDWSGIDNAISAAMQYGKKISVNVSAGIGTPSWLYSEGARGFNYVWDKNFGPPLCSVVTIPVPWDPVFLDRWGKFVAALGARYGESPYVSSVKLTGVNSNTGETGLPYTVDESINNGQCTGYNDVADWLADGYTRSKVEQAWQQIAADFSAAFPDRPFAAMLHPCGFPPIDDNGNIISGAACDSQIATDFLAYGIQDYGRGRFIGQNNGWGSFLWSTLVADSAYIDTGYQAVSALGSNFSQDAQNAVNGHAKFLEVYPADLAGPSLQSAIQTINQQLLANH